MEPQSRSFYIRWALIASVAAAALAPSPNSAAPADVILRAAAATTVRGAWSVVADASAAGGSRMSNPNAGAPKPSTAAVAPTSYFELTFAADAGVPYRLWI